jgi:hypothetical protein
MPKFDSAESPSAPLKGAMADASTALSPAAFTRIRDQLESEGVEMRVHVFQPPVVGVNGVSALFKVVACDFFNNKGTPTLATVTTGRSSLVLQKTQRSLRRRALTVFSWTVWW